MLADIFKELLGSSRFPGAAKHDPRGGGTVSRNMQLTLRSRLLEYKKASEPS
jgi:hypothetical protein